ncbi:DDE family transposase, partial [Dysgonomonas alginatilytica]
MILSLCKVQTVNFERLAQGFESSVSTGSSLRRIQRFMADYMLDKDLICRMIYSLLPHKPPYRLIIDRTNWKFGQININILVLSIAYKGISFPLVYRMMPKRGASSINERIEIMEHYIRLFGKDSIKDLLADREFIGEKWFGWLNINAIRYHIRILSNYQVMHALKGKYMNISRLFESLKIGQCKFLAHPYYVTGRICFLSACCFVNDKGRRDLVIIASFDKTRASVKAYKERWQIESLFRALKTSGFNIEKTHLRDMERFEKMLSMVFIAFLWAYLTGMYIHRKIKKIRILKHGRLAKSFFKYGLDYIFEYLYKAYYKQNIDPCKFLSCTE